jgi:hypothetical protein
MSERIYATDPTTARSSAAGSDDRYGPGVSWGAVFAGAVGNGGLSLILVLLGLGLGFTLASPWAGGAGAQAIGIGAIIWLTFTQLASAGLGGYLAGRLRVKWQSVDTEEVFFRDTSHGFLSWAVATLASAVLLSGVMAGMLGAVDVGRPPQGAAAAGGGAFIWMSAALLIGAFVASYCATLGGRHRDSLTGGTFSTGEHDTYGGDRV